MDKERAQKIAEALDSAADAYRDAAQEEMNAGYSGSVYNVYHAMRECISLQGKAGRLRRNHSC